MKLNTDNEPANRWQILDQLGRETDQRVRGRGDKEFDKDDLAASREMAKAHTFAHAGPTFDPAKSVSDRKHLEHIERQEAELRQQKECRRNVAARQRLVREQIPEVPPPDKKSFRALQVAAPLLFAAIFAVTLYGVFFADIGDAVLGVTGAVVFAAAAAFFITLNLLRGGEGREEPGDGRRSVERAAVLIGVGLGVLRLTKVSGLEDIAAALGLTLTEVAGVLLLRRYGEWYQEQLARSRRSRELRVALDEEMASIDQDIERSEVKLHELLTEQRRRELESFDVERLAEGAASVVEVAYRGAIIHNQRQLDGGSPSHVMRSGRPDYGKETRN